MTKDGHKTQFTLADLPKSPIRDKDNAMPRIPPPKTVQIPHPQLAPPGMSGIKTQEKRFTLTGPLPERPKPKIEMGQEGRVKRAFEPHVQAPPGKGWSIDR